MLTVKEVQLHEVKLKRILFWDLVWIALLIIGASVDRAVSDLFLAPAALLLVAQAVRWMGYVMRDLRLRGRSPVWVYFASGPIGFAVWLLWRRRHPIPTRNTVGLPPA